MATLNEGAVHIKGQPIDRMKYDGRALTIIFANGATLTAEAWAEPAEYGDGFYWGLKADIEPQPAVENGWIVL